MLLLLGFLAYQFRDFFSVYEQVKSTVKINDKLTLYVTEVSKSSLSKDTYNYYFYDADKSADDFLTHVKSIEPVMTTDDYKASAEVKDGDIYFRVRGNVYAFRSVGYNVSIHLDTSPY
ncbi:hypothetical protein ACQSED_13675 [Salmonella enterica]|uniref:hypothetical protein n=1 Tax=Salmonella enterica TaxID=28901 RepID=UPI0035CDD4EA